MMNTIVKIRTIVLTVLACFLCLSVCFADNAMMGTWKLNEAKSKIPTGAPKSITVTYETAGDSIKSTIDGTAPDGKPTHTEWTGKFDGKDYPVSDGTTRSVKLISDHKMDVAVKKDGKVIFSGNMVVAADGKSRTVTLNGMDPSGKKMKSVAVYDKQ